jgi:hypothetical protein
VKGNPGPAGESGQRFAAIAHEMISGGHDPLQHGGDRGAVGLRQNGVQRRALPVAGDEDGNIILIGPRMPRRPTPFPRFSRQIGPAALEGFKDEGFIRLDDSA